MQGWELLGWLKPAAAERVLAETLKPKPLLPRRLGSPPGKFCYPGQWSALEKVHRAAKKRALIAGRPSPDDGARLPTASLRRGGACARGLGGHWGVHLEVQ